MLCGGGFLVVVVWAAVWVWAGRGLLLVEGRVADRRALVCGVVGCLVLGVGNTPVVLLLPACVGSGVWWVPSRGVGVACCRGSGAVRPGCLTRLGLLVVGVLGWVWVGWL